MLEREINQLVECLACDIAPKLAARLDGHIRAIIREEFKLMSDPLTQAIADLTAATNAELAEISVLLAAVQNSATGITQAAAAGDAAAVEAQVAVLTKSVSDAQAALAALQGTSPAPVASGAGASPAPVAAAAQTA